MGITKAMSDDENDSRSANTRPAISADSVVGVASIIGDPPRIPAAPYPIEQTCVHTKSTPLDLYNAMRLAFDAGQVDRVFTPGNFRWDCMSYPGFIAVQFVVRVYLTASDGFLIEFQRRNGCGLAFRQVFNALCASLSPILVTAPATATRRAAATASVRSRRDVAPLHRMLTASCEVQAAQALELVAKWSARRSGRDVLVAHGTLRRLFPLLLSAETTNVRRLVTTILAACSHTIVAHAALLGLAVDAMPGMVVVLQAAAETTSPLATMELARQTRELLGAVLRTGAAAEHPSYNSAQALVRRQ